jgi:hypothetical protein
MQRDNLKQEMKNVLEDYYSPLDKEAMYSNFMARTRKKRNRPLAFILIFISLTVLTAMIFFQFYQHEQRTEYTDKVDDFKIDHSLSETKQAEKKKQKLASAFDEIVESPSAKTSRTNLIDNSHTEISNGNTHSSKDRIAEHLTFKTSVYFPIPKPEQEAGLKNGQVNTSFQNKPLGTGRIASLPYLESDRFLLHFERKFHLTNKGVVYPMSQDLERPNLYNHRMGIMAGYVSLKSNDINRDYQTIDRIRFTIEGEWLNKKKWSINSGFSYFRTNIMHEGTLLLQESFDTLGASAMTTMINESLSGNSEPSYKETNYVLLQDQNSLGLHFLAGRYIDLSSNTRIYLGGGPIIEYVWSSNGSWKNSERGVHIDYTYEDLKPLILQLHGSIGIEWTIDEQSALQMRGLWNQDITNRRSVKFDDKLDGLGFQLGLMRLIN